MIQIQRGDQVKKVKENVYLQVKERVPQRKQPCPHLDLRPLASRTVSEKINSCWLSVRKKKKKEGRRKEISLGWVSWSCSSAFQCHQLQFDFSGARNELAIAWTALGFCTFLDLGSHLPYPTLSFTASSHCPSWGTLPKPQASVQSWSSLCKFIILCHNFLCNSNICHPRVPKFSIPLE